MSLPDSSSCHHCHIHAPIPARDLKRTHPLRSHFVEKDENVPAPQNNEPTKSSFKKNVSFLYRKINKRNIKNVAKESQTNVSIPIPPPPPPSRVVDCQPAVVVDSLPSAVTLPQRPVSLTRRQRRRSRGLAGLQAVLLVGAYALLLVLAVVIGVVLSQQPRRGRVRASVGTPLPPPRPVFNQETFSPRVRVSRPRFAGAPRIGSPRQQAVGTAAPAPRPPPAPRPAPALRPIPAPRPAPPTTTPFADYDYAYVDDTDQALTLVPNPLPTPRPTLAPAPPPFRPPPTPVFTQQPEKRRPTSAPRRTTVPLASIDSDFSLRDDAPIRGRKEPGVKILRSWSHQNNDGTFSWGYLNDDGSFKNETRGLDCVVRGVYGYTDTVTGQQLSFPYESGNPCDPDAPDYFYDYDTNTMLVNEGGEVRSLPSSSGGFPRRRQG